VLRRAGEASGSGQRISSFVRAAGFVTLSSVGAIVLLSLLFAVLVLIFAVR